MKKLLVLLCIALAAPVWAQTPAKYALVIGNGTYTETGSLRNAVNDANDMAAALERLGFNVKKLINASLQQMDSEAVALKNRLSVSRNAYGFLFYAGHGVQLNGVNYLIPSDANIPDSAYLKTRAFPVQTMLDMLNSAGNALNVVVLDACRNLPAAWSRSMDRGLSVVGRQPADSIIIYATAAGDTASDGAGRNGLFTGSLLKNLAVPGLEINEVIRRTGQDVARASNGKQRPATYIAFYDTAYMGAPTVQPAARVERPVPGGFVRVEGGTFQMGSNNGDDDEKPMHSVTVKSFYIGKYEVTQKEWVEVMGGNPSDFKGDNRPVEQVSWNDVVEYCNRRSVKEGLTPAYTVSGYAVTWNRNADGYRLPTEAEWEFAAKGGIKGGAGYTYSGSDNADAVALYNGSTTHDVGTKMPNSLGLYDMSGNVYEWCWDWYGSYGSGAQTDPLGASSGSNRVLRGGSWLDAAEYARSANRDNGTPAGRFGICGFRLVRP